MIWILFQTKFSLRSIRSHYLNILALSKFSLNFCRSILDAKTALMDVTQDLTERTQRWRQIEIICGFSILSSLVRSKLLADFQFFLCRQEQIICRFFFLSLSAKTYHLWISILSLSIRTNYLWMFNSVSVDKNKYFWNKNIFRTWLFYREFFFYVGIPPTMLFYLFFPTSTHTLCIT